MKRILLAALIMMLGAAGPSAANDSTATMGAGGLVYTTSSKIRIERESLTISEDHVSQRIQGLLKDDNNQLKVDDAARIIGKASSEIEKILGFIGRDELVHRNDMVLEV